MHINDDTPVLLIDRLTSLSKSLPLTDAERDEYDDLISVVVWAVIFQQQVTPTTRTHLP